MPRKSKAKRADLGPLLEQALPLLLHGDHLPTEARLACFGVNKATAALVLKHAQRTKLQFTLGQVTSASIKAAQQLAAQSSNVSLVLHKCLISPAACMWQSITSITLQGVQLTAKDLSSRSQLQLHKLPRLHTLTLQGGDIELGSSRLKPTTGPNAVAAPSVASSVRTLRVTRWRTSPFTSLLRMALPLVDPAQLQTLITDDEYAADLLAQLPALQEVQLLTGLMRSAVNDDRFRKLLSHPTLTRVSLPRLYLREDYSTHPCSWTSLQLEEGATAHDLAALPLASIQSCTIRGSLYAQAVTSSIEKAISIAATCPHLALEPSAVNSSNNTNEAGYWRPAEPLFRLHVGSCTNDQAARFVGQMVRHVTGAALIIEGIASRALIANLADAAPPTITTVCFSMRYPGPGWEGVDHVELEDVVTLLPEHITHIILCSGFHDYDAYCLWWVVLRWFMKGVTRPLRLTLLNPTTPCSMVQQQVCRWLSACASNQVQVEFQRGGPE